VQREKGAVIDSYMGRGLEPCRGIDVREYARLSICLSCNRVYDKGGPLDEFPKYGLEIRGCCCECAQLEVSNE